VLADSHRDNLSHQSVDEKIKIWETINLAKEGLALYDRPVIYITENGISIRAGTVEEAVEDRKRINYIRDDFSEARKAQTEGVAGAATLSGRCSITLNGHRDMPFT
jgi:beta-glucosidase/6-phospho-beta-glucosidase/beta-galactosidase